MAQAQGVELQAESLPPVVHRFAERARAAGDESPKRVRVTQVGEMVMKPGSRARRFTATEEFAVDHVAFSWRARFPLALGLSLHVVDSYDEGDASLEVRLLGVPLQRNRGPELAQGQAFRYLAELAWVPHAIMVNPNLRWRAIDERSAEVSTKLANEWIALRLSFDDGGDLKRTSAQRPRLERPDLGKRLTSPTRVTMSLPHRHSATTLPPSASAYCLD